MYRIQIYEEQSYQMFRLKNESQNTWITVCPELGGILTEFAVNGEHQLYLNKPTLFDPNKSVRGGNPILFPISGGLENQQYEWEGKIYQMPNHGVARDMPWDVIETKETDDFASISIGLISNESTFTKFPFQFSLEFTYILKGNELRIEQKYRNLSDQSMPMYPGLHPYFLSDTNSFRIVSDARAYLELADSSKKDLKDHFNKDEFYQSLVLMDLKTPSVSFEVLKDKKITMKASPEFRYWVLWTEKDKEFICVEPWMALPNELNRKEELVMVPPKSVVTSFVNIIVD